MNQTVGTLGFDLVADIARERIAHLDGRRQLRIAVAKDLGCEEAFARYLQTLPPVAPLPRMPEEAFETLPAESARDPRIPPAGTVLVRHFGDRDHRVTVTGEGFMLGRHRYRSLSAVAKAITGKHWNGFLFFGLDAA